jgi:hypothetical protein
MRDYHPGHAGAWSLLHGICDDTHRSRLDGSVDVAITIGGFATHSYEDLAGAHTPRVVLDSGYIDVPSTGKDLDTIQKLLQRHY